MNRRSRFCGPVALAMFAAAAMICGTMLDGYSHREHPLALLGAVGVPGALAFNTLAFVLPGLLVAFLFWTMRSALPATAGWRARIGTQLATLSALAFAAQGLFPLDPEDLGGQANALHALAWTMWWIAFAAAGALLAASAQSRGFRRAMVVASIAVLALALPPWPGAMAAFAPRLAFLVWFAWATYAGREAPLSRA
ncbi:MAG: DUF998 domain-containing protein [Pseudomonadota bacterium]